MIFIVWFTRGKDDRTIDEVLSDARALMFGIIGGVVLAGLLILALNHQAEVSDTWRWAIGW